MSIEVKRFLDLGLKDVDTDIDEGVKKINVTITKAGEAAGNSLASVPLSSLCTSACFSTVSSVTKAALSEKRVDPEELRSLVALHEKAVEVVGEKGMIEAAGKLSKEAPEKFLRQLKRS